MNLADTIAAISTPYGKGGVALIRISGADAVQIADRIFRTPKGRAASALEDRRASFGKIYSPSIAEGSGKANTTDNSIDDVLLTVMRAPSTFTGEDTVEICCHGGILVTQAVLEAALEAGARPALAGEFTRRAFVNGKMTLSGAESLGMLLEATTDTQLKLYRSGMLGKLSERTNEIYTALCAVQSSLFAAIDYPDEDLAEMSREQMTEALERAAESTRVLAATYKTGRAISDGIAAVICGKPNAGKSSLYNLLVGYDAAIVTDIKGTTRDVLTQSASLGKVRLLLKDTAGIRQDADVVESIGIRRALDEIGDAELILAVFDSSAPLEREDEELIGTLKGTHAVRVAVLNKADVAETDGYARDFEARFKDDFDDIVIMSAATGSGLDELCAVVESKYVDGSLSIGNDAVVMNARQAASLTEAHGALLRAIEQVEAGAELDMCCADVELALIALGGVDGRAVSEDVVSGIFSHFCVGK